MGFLWRFKIAFENFAEVSLDRIRCDIIFNLPSHYFGSVLVDFNHLLDTTTDVTGEQARDLAHARDIRQKILGR